MYYVINVWRLTFQAYTFRGHDESYNSKNQDNFFELLALLELYNKDVVNVVLESKY